MNERVRIIRRTARLRESREVLPPDNENPNNMLIEAATPATLMAHNLGLSYYGFDRWGKDGIATHLQDDNRTKITPIAKPIKIVKSDELKAKNIAHALVLSKSSVSYKFPKDTSDENLKKVSDNIKHTQNIRSAMDILVSKPKKYDHNTGSRIDDPKRKSRIDYMPINRYDLKALINSSRRQVEKLHTNEIIGLERYTANLSTNINKTLRDMVTIKNGDFAGVSFSTRDNDESAKALKNINKAFKELRIKQEIVVYRGVSAREAQNLKMEVGSIVDIQNYLSTSLDPAIAYAFNDAGNMLVIRVPKNTHGVFVAGFSSHAVESEVILDRGAQIRIKKVVELIPEGYRDEAIAELQRLKGDVDNSYKPTRQEILANLKANGHRIHRKYIAEVIGHKKALNDEDINKLDSFIQKYKKPEKLIPVDDAVEDHKKHLKKLTLKY